MEAMACNDIITLQVPHNVVMCTTMGICGVLVTEN